ncbi:MAG: hypothetical protein QXE05_08695, partial [Nitrososphaeria archaeon]
MAESGLGLLKHVLELDGGWEENFVSINILSAHNVGLREKSSLGLQSFREAVAASVDSVLSRTLGPKCSIGLKRLFLKEYGLCCLEDVADCPRKFEEFARKVFGRGADLVLNRVAAELCRRLSLD